MSDNIVTIISAVLVAIIGGGSVGLLEVGWLQALSVAALAAVLSMLTSVSMAMIQSLLTTIDTFMHMAVKRELTEMQQRRRAEMAAIVATSFPRILRHRL